MIGDGGARWIGIELNPAIWLQRYVRNPGCCSCGEHKIGSGAFLKVVFAELDSMPAGSYLQREITSSRSAFPDWIVVHENIRIRRSAGDLKSRGGRKRAR